jgi:hypothetical protein
MFDQFTLPGWTRALRPAGWIAIGLCILIALGGVTWCATRSRIEPVKIDAARSKASGESARDAIGTISANDQSEDNTEATTRENRDAILGTKGARDPVAPDTDRAGRLSICRRESARNLPECKSL